MNTVIIIIITFLVTLILSYFLFNKKTKFNLLGFKYNTTNTGVINTMKATQELINTLQSELCKPSYKNKVLSMISNLPDNTKNMTTDEAKKLVKTQFSKKNDLLGQDLTFLNDSLLNLSYVIIDNSSSNGKADINALKLYLTNIVNAFC
jgi:hypothetical protein